jgi:CO dehydrogenase maturation factor
MATIVAGQGSDERDLVPAQSSGGGLRIVVTGKGGVGKTTLSAALARVLAREGRRVLAVDADAQLNLAAALGMPRTAAETLVPLSRNADYVAEKTGARPGEGYGLLFRLNPDVDDVVDRFGQHAPDGVRFLAMGTLSGAGNGCLCPENTLLAETIRAIGLRTGEAIVMDTQAGVEHFGRAIARGFDHAIVTTDPTYSGIRVAIAAARLARDLGIPSIHLVVNRLRGRADRIRLMAELSTADDFPFTSRTRIPDDDLVLAAEPSVDSLFDIPGEPFIAAVQRLSCALTANLAAVSGPAETDRPMEAPR